MSPNQKILYVDDEDSNRFIFQTALEDEFDIEVAENGEAALRFLEQHEVAIVVSDQRMPGMTGNQLLTSVKSRWPRTVRMIVTGYGDVDAILQSVNEGLVARYVVKPWEEDRLREMLRWGLEAFELANEKHGTVIQERLFESERLASMGTIQLSFLHEVGNLLGYITDSVGELETFLDYVGDISALVDNDSKHTPQHWQKLRTFLLDFPELLDYLKMGALLLGHLRGEVDRLMTGPTSTGGDKGLCSVEELQRSIRFAMAVNKAEATLANAVLHYDQSEQVSAIAIAPEDLLQVLINLIRNAIQSLVPQKPGNEVTIRVETNDVENLAIVAVSDNGKGMNKELVDRVGQPFHTTRKKGTGLGTYRCKTILSKVGGSLEYQSELDKGTVAVATIPLARN